MALQDDALRLIELSRQVEQAVEDLRKNNSNEFVRALAEYVKLRVSLQHRMLDEDVDPSEDSRAREVLHKISPTGEGLEADRFVKAYGEVTGNSDLAAFGELDDSEVEELGLGLFYSWYSHYEYVRALAELRPLIPGCAVSSTLKRLVGEVRRCYAFQQFDATLAMCRALLEASARDIGERRGVIRPKVTYDWKFLRNRISSGLLNKKLEDLYKRLSEVSHARREASAREALSAVRETLSTIEELYKATASPEDPKSSRN